MAMASQQGGNDGAKGRLVMPLALNHPRTGVGIYVGPNKRFTGKQAHLLVYNDYIMAQFDDQSLPEAFGRYRFEHFEFKNVRLYE